MPLNKSFLFCIEISDEYKPISNLKQLKIRDKQQIIGQCLTAELRYTICTNEYQALKASNVKGSL